MQREHWHLTEGLIFAHFAVFILGATMSGGHEALAVIPGLVGARPWTLVTYQFLHGNNMFWFFISMLVLWIMARPLEENWGSLRFLLFWLISTFGASLTAVALGYPLFGDLGFSTCLLFTFATLYPDVEKHLMWRDFSTLARINKCSGRFHPDIIGIAQSVGQTGRDRPSPITPIENLYLVGADVGQDNIGTELAAESALRLEAILEERGAI